MLRAAEAPAISVVAEAAVVVSVAAGTVPSCDRSRVSGPGNQSGMVEPVFKTLFVIRKFGPGFGERVAAFIIGSMEACLRIRIVEMFPDPLVFRRKRTPASLKVRGVSRQPTVLTEEKPSEPLLAILITDHEFCEIIRPHVGEQHFFPYAPAEDLRFHQTSILLGLRFDDATPTTLDLRVLIQQQIVSLPVATATVFSFD
jgi:hypothetical protein